jgi:protein-S-isoprenylcysteine O-methyltransferase Ste14
MGTLNSIYDPFFWALLSMFALVGAGVVVGGQKLGSYPLFGIVIVIIFGLGRVILVLPPLIQPRFEIGGWHWILGGTIFAAGLLFCLPALTIRPFTAPDEGTKIKTTGFYGIVRNPIYLGELLWGLGWAIMFRSTIGVALLPLWWAGLLFLVLVEEQSLERELGLPYLKYKERVRGRIIPGLPI